MIGVAFGGERFVAVGWNGVVLTSKNGVAWARQNAATKSKLLAVNYSDDHFTAVDEFSQQLESVNGSKWTHTMILIGKATRAD